MYANEERTNFNLYMYDVYSQMQKWKKKSKQIRNFFLSNNNNKKNK